MAVLQSILLCDRVYIDAASGKMVLAGTFHKIAVAEFPASYAEGAVLYLAFREVREEIPVSVEFVDVADNRALYTFRTFRVPQADVFETVEVALPLPTLHLPHEGRYAFDVFTGSTFLGTFRLGAEP